MSELVLSEFSQKGEDIYNTRIQSELPPGLKGKIVAIEVESGDYFIEDTPLKACIEAKKNTPINNSILSVLDTIPFGNR